MAGIMYSVRFYPKTIRVCWLWNAIFGSHTPHVIRDHRVTKGVTSPYANRATHRFKREWVPLATIPLPRPRSESVFKRSEPHAESLS